MQVYSLTLHYPWLPGTPSGNQTTQKETIMVSNLPAPSTFQAVWPVLTGDGHSTLTDNELIDDALADLHSVAARHGVTITGKPRATLTTWEQIPGYTSTNPVIIAEAPAKETRLIGVAA